MCSSTLTQNTVSKRCDASSAGSQSSRGTRAARTSARPRIALAHLHGAGRVGLDAHDDVGHVGQPLGHGADAAPDFEHAPADVGPEQLEQMRGVALRALHRFEVVGGVAVLGLGVAAVDVVHAHASAARYHTRTMPRTRSADARRSPSGTVLSCTWRTAILRRATCSAHLGTRPSSTTRSTRCSSPRSSQWNATHLPFTDAWWQFPDLSPDAATCWRSPSTCSASA